jgi:hypothetical protein
VYLIKDNKSPILVGNMPTTEYKEARKCVCGYTTMKINLWSKHYRCCKLVPNEKDARIATLEKVQEQLNKQLVAKDEQIKEKDGQIRELIKANKKPRTVTNNTTNRYVVEQHINVFGKETLSHISPQQIHRLLADPENAVAKFVKLKHRAPSNANVRCPNVNRAIYQVVVGSEGGEKEWENRAKGEVLEKLYDDNSSILEGEAVEEEHTPFLDHQDRVKASAAANAADGGRCYKQQLDMIHNVII